MNTDHPQSRRDQLEARLTALLLGELSADEATDLRQIIAADPHLAELYQRLERTIPMVREATASHSETANAQRAPLKLSDQRRQQLLAHFKTVAPKEFARPPRRQISWVIPYGIAATLVGLLSVALLPRSNRVYFMTTGVHAGRPTPAAEAAIEELQVQMAAAGPPPPDLARPKASKARDSQSGQRLENPAGTRIYLPDQTADLALRNEQLKDSEQEVREIIPVRSLNRGRQATDLAPASNAPKSPGGDLAPNVLSSDEMARGITSERSRSNVYSLNVVGHVNIPPAAGFQPVTSEGIAPSPALTTPVTDFFSEQPINLAIAPITVKPLAMPQTEVALGVAEPAGIPPQAPAPKLSPGAIMDTNGVLGWNDGYLAEGKPVELFYQTAPAPGNPVAVGGAVASAAPSSALHLFGATDGEAAARSYGTVGGFGGGGFGGGGGQTEQLHLPVTLAEAKDQKTSPGASPLITRGSSVQTGAPEIPAAAVVGGSAIPIVYASPSDIYQLDGFGLGPAMPGKPESGAVRKPAEATVAAADSAKLPVLGDEPVIGQQFYRYKAPDFDFALTPPPAAVPAPVKSEPPQVAFQNDALAAAGNIWAFGGESQKASERKPVNIDAANYFNSGTMNVSSTPLAPMNVMRYDSPHVEDETALMRERKPLENLKQLGWSDLRQALPTAAGDPGLSQMVQDQTTAERKLAKLRSDLGEDHSDVIRAAKTLKDLDAKIDSRMDGIMLGLEARAAGSEALPSKAEAPVEAGKPITGPPAAMSAPVEIAALDSRERKMALTDLQADIEVKNGRLLVEAGKLDAAEKQLESAQKEDPLNPAAQAYLKKLTPAMLEELRNAPMISKSAEAQPAAADPKTGPLWQRRYGRAPAAAPATDTLAKNERTENEAILADAIQPDLIGERELERQRTDLATAGTEKAVKQLGEIDQGIAQADAKSPGVQKPAAQPADVASPRPAAPVDAPQPEVQTAENAFSTFSLNVSDVGFKLAAASLEKGVMPDAASVRSEEFLNAFDYHDPEPSPGAPIGFVSERARDPFAHNRDLLRFSVKTAAAGRQPGRPLNLVLLLDNSGSMERADRVEIIHEALRVLAAQLQPQDQFSVVTFARTPRLWVDGVPGNQAGEVVEKISGLTPEGGTNLEEAMKLAYATAARHYSSNGVNRVVLLTDGAANLGDVNPAVLKQKVEAQRQQGIALDCFGIGWEGYNDDLLEQLSRNGDGRYGFINTPAEAASGFAAQLAGALNVAASDVKVQIEFNPKRVTAYRQIGYAKHQLTKAQFRDNTVDAAEIGAAESGNALYVVEVNPQGEGPLGTVRVRYKVPGTSDYPEHAWEVPFAGNAVPLEQASPAMRLAATASAFSEWLVSSPYAAEVTPDQLLGYLAGVPEICGADQRPKKLEWMIRQAKAIAGK